jgi:ABC-type sugar transport system ATPase subunit
MKAPAQLEVQRITAGYQALPVIRDVTCSAGPGSVVSLLGPSGCGKSTLLRVIAGLVAPSSGDVLVDGRSILGLAPGRRDLALVFQNYALYPHLSVRRNLSLALESQRLDRGEIARRIEAVTSMLMIGELLERKPRSLSGGQQQRVALARALVREPRLYLLDEPLSNLDALLREEMRSELKALFRRLGATVVYVTHDQTEALTISDTMVVLDRGAVQQIGAPEEVYARPSNLFVAGFVGTPRMNLISGRIAEGTFRADGWTVPGAPSAASTPETAVVLGLRPEHVEIADAGAPESLPAQVELLENLGSHVLVTLRAGAQRLRVLASAPPVASAVGVRFPVARRHWFDAVTGTRLAARSA